MIRAFVVAAALLCASCVSATPGAGEDVCTRAAAHVASCTGEAPPTAPAEGCTGDFADAAATLEAQSCEQLTSPVGKADASSAYCAPFAQWLHLCEVHPIEELAAVPTTEGVCRGRSDDLCRALMAGDLSSARDAARAMAGTFERETLLSDPAFQVYVRDRVLSLLVYNVLTERGAAPADPSSYGDAAGRELEALMPSYAEGAFPAAQQLVPPEVRSCASPDAAVVILPGVVRDLHWRDFESQLAGVEAALPCVVTSVAPTGTFIDPHRNAESVRDEVDYLRSRYGVTGVNLLGYSQGARNLMQTLVDFPDVARDTRSAMTMNSAARGSEVGDVLYDLLRVFDAPGSCRWAPAIARPLCDWAALQSTEPNQFMLEFLARNMAMDPADLELFLAREDTLAPGSTLADFFEAHLPGVRSLTTEDAARFWRDEAPALPRTTLYFSFRSFISDTAHNLPASNLLSFELLKRAGGMEPYNDMQVRLVNQELGGPIADLEIRSPLFEGNHWQWEWTTGQLSESTLPASMTDPIPQTELLIGYYQTLDELDLLR